MLMTVDRSTIPEALRRLRSAGAPSGRVLSAYVDTSPARQAGRGVALAIRAARQALRPTITPAERAAYERAGDQIERCLADAPAAPGLALFAADDDGYFTAVPLPSRPREALVWAEGPLLAPLEAALDDEERLAVALFDSEHTRLFTVYLGAIEARREFADDVPAKQATGGWYGLAQAGIVRHREAQLLRHARRTVAALSDLLRAAPFDRLLLAGPDEARAILRGQLPRPLRARYAGALALALDASDAAVLAAARQAGERLERQAELAAVVELFEALATPHAVAGLEATLAALDAGRVHRLLLAPAAGRPGARCPRCDRLLARVGQCPACGEAAEPLTDLDEALLERALAQGARIELVAGEAAAGGADRAGGGRGRRPARSLRRNRRLHALRRGGGGRERMMALEIKLVASGFPLGAEQERRVRRRLGALERRLALRSDPIAILRLTRHADQRRVEVELRVQLGSLGEHLVSRQAAETLDAALRLAVGDVERQLERGLATQRGERTFGSPSRRLPKALRPHPPGSAAPVAPMAKGDR